MLACKHCSTPNSLDSTFCKKCGTALPADQRREAALQLDRLVDEGLAALSAGRVAEALAVADSALLTDPTHLGALHLKASAHERRGEIAEALESADRIVELNPDSELDRIKRNGLRTALLNASTPEQPDRRVAFAAAAAAMVLVACAGILLARRGGSAPETVVASNLDTPVLEAPVQVTQTPAGNVALTTAPTQGTSIGAAPDTAAVPPVGERRSSDIVVPANPNLDQLPAPTGSIGVNTSLRPLDPPTPAQGSNPSVKPTVSRNDSGDPAPTTIVPKSAEAQEDPGTIEISVNHGGAKVGGSRMIPESRTNGAAAYARVGQERFGLGDYAGAAANLEKAVAGGGNPVGLNLMLAQAYGRLGRNSDAAQAYERSKAAAEAAIASGKGDRERLQAQRDAAEAGLRTVRGG